MKCRLTIVFCVASMVVLSSFTGAAVRNAGQSQRQAFDAQEALAQKRLEFVAIYQKCVIEAQNDLERIEACDVYLKSAEALS